VVSASNRGRPPAVEAAPVPMRGRWAAVARWLRWVLAALLLALTVRLIVVNPTPFLELAHVQPHVLGAMVGLMVLNQWLTSRRFQLVMRHCAGVELSAGRWFQLTSVGQFLNLFVPQLGHVYRGVVLQREAGLSYSAYSAGLFVFFWFELLVGIALAAVVVAAHDAGFRLGGIHVLPLLLVGLGALSVLPRTVSITIARVRRRSSRALRVLENAHSALLRTQSALRCRPVVAKFVALNLVVVAEQVAMLWIAFDSVGGAPGVGRLMLFQVLLKLSAMFFITPGNLGITELAYGALAGASSTGVQQGIAAALLMRTLGTVVLVGLGAALGGASVLMRDRRQLAALRGSYREP
jgi:uncharacterized membrane protein YbhN (UPF0104 family)